MLGLRLQLRVLAIAGATDPERLYNRAMASPISWPLLPVPPGPPPDRIHPEGCGVWQTPFGTGFGCNWDRQEIELLRYAASVEVVLVVLIFACGASMLLVTAMTRHRQSPRWTPLQGLGMVVLALALGAHLTGLYLYGASLALRLIVAAAVPLLGIAASALLMPNVVGAVRHWLGLRPPGSSPTGLPNR